MRAGTISVSPIATSPVAWRTRAEAVQSISEELRLSTWSGARLATAQRMAMPKLTAVQVLFTLTRGLLKRETAPSQTAVVHVREPSLSWVEDVSSTVRLTQRIRSLFSVTATSPTAWQQEKVEAVQFMHVRSAALDVSLTQSTLQHKQA